MGSVEFGREVLEVEAAAIRRAASRLSESFDAALDLLDRVTGKVLTTGVGKSGIAARKLSATLTSTGCPAVFLHPSEAMHGDLGIVSVGDVVIALSNGGESEELLAILPALLGRGTPIIAIVGNDTSTLAQKATLVIDASIEREACPLNLAPTTSVVVALALGDALAMALHRLRGFRPEDYAYNHPGGRLGRRLLLHVSDVMRGQPGELPLVLARAPLMDVLGEIGAKNLGATAVVNEQGKLGGIITDFDVRQAFQKHGGDALALTAADVMNCSPALVFRPAQLAFEALQAMENRPRAISVAPVVDASGVCIGMIHVHDLVRSGL